MRHVSVDKHITWAQARAHIYMRAQTHAPTDARTLNTHAQVDAEAEPEAEEAETEEADETEGEAEGDRQRR